MTKRVDDAGVAYAGSQLQTQLYVNVRTAELDAAIRAEFPELAGATIAWRSPLAAEKYAEYWDKSFLDSVDLGDCAADLNAFWPAGGPHWDALAVVAMPDSDRPGVLLAEGKSYPGELYGSGCQAKPKSKSRDLIERSMADTQRKLSVADKTLDDWCGSLYQTANRLAHQQWLRSRGVRAWLVHLLFVDDPINPTTETEWVAAMTAADRELGIEHRGVDGAGHVLLKSRPRSDIAPANSD